MKNQPILLLITTQDWGGAQAFLFDLACDMQKKGLPVKVCAGGQGELGEKCREAGITFIQLKHMARDINPITNLISLFELFSLFRREQPRAIHLNSTMMGVVGSLAAKLTSVPWTVYCIGGWVFNEQLPAWKKKVYIWIEKTSAHWKDLIVCVHPGDTELARRLGIVPRERLMTIPNGIDVDTFEKQLLDKALAREALYPPPLSNATNITSKNKIIGTVANAYPPKNLIWYLDICKKVIDKNPDFYFVIIGDGPQMAALRQKHSELKLNNHVLLTGRRMDAQKLYRAFDAFVLPSTKEGMSITLLEAMASHVPIIATDVGANSWMLNQTSVIVPPNNQDSMTEAILNIANIDQQRDEMSEQAYQEVRARFSWQVTSEETIKTLLEN